MTFGFVVRFHFLVFLFLIWAADAPAVAGSDFGSFDHEFERIVSEAKVPGGAYVIVDRGRLVHAAAFGTRAAGGNQPVEPDTVFRVASVSKTFAAQLTALLVDDGVLDWKDPVIRFVPELRIDHPDHARQLQIRHLLGQSTGIVPNAYDNLLDASQPVEQIVPRFGELKPLCRPGQCYTYQNVLFALVEPAIEQATRRSYGDLLRERVFEPLGMQNASTGMAAYLDSPNRAMPHVRRGSRWRTTEVNENYYRVMPAAGVNASVMDLGRWLAAQMGHRPDVINPGLVDELTQKRVHTARDMRRRGWRELLTDAHYGLGWRIYTIDQEEIFLHSGWVRGFVAEVGYSRDRRIGLAVALNAESSALNEFTTLFWSRVLAEPRMMVEHEPPDPESDRSAGTRVAGAISGD